LRVTADPIQLFLSVYCAIIAFQMLIHFRDQLDFWRTRPWQVYGKPPKLLGILRIPAVSERTFIIAGIGFIFALIAVMLDRARAVALVVALVCFVIYFPPILPLSYIQRKASPVPVVLAIALVAPRQLLMGVKLLLALAYLSAGVEKLLTAGPQWADGRSLQTYLIEHYLYSGRTQGLFLAKRPWLCRMVSAGVLSWELSFWLVLIFPVMTWIYVIAGVLFHAATAVTMRINYWIYFCPAYVIFLVPSLERMLSGAG
jgi:hypothetical protein